MIAIIFLIAISFSVVVLISFSSEKNKHNISLSNECLKETTSYNKNEYQWTGIVKVRNYKKYILVYVTKNLAYIIPKKYFNSKQEQDEFLEFIYNKIRI